MGARVRTRRARARRGGEAPWHEATQILRPFEAEQLAPAAIMRLHAYCGAVPVPRGQASEEVR